MRGSGPRISLHLRRRARSAWDRLQQGLHPDYQLNFLGRGRIGMIDVGSVGGLPSPWKGNARHLRFLLNFDPNVAPTQGASFRTLDCALWESAGSRPFYIYRGLGGTGSSLFRQNTPYVREHFDQLRHRGPGHLADTWFERSQLVKTVTVPCRTIDDIVYGSPTGNRFQFMKIDAQGAELPILKGAGRFLAKDCIGLHLELFVLPLYDGIALLDEVCDFLDQRGFHLAHKYPAHGSFDSQHDCLFLKGSGDRELISLVRRIYDLS